MPSFDASGIHPIIGWAGYCHLLTYQNKAVLVDTGLQGEPSRLSRLVERLGLKPSDIKAIVLTHGHLDHAAHAAWARDWSQAPIYAHPLEAPHLDGTYDYAGKARVCGMLEALGRRALNYRPATIDHLLADGEELPFWGGLRVLHLPGHTAGHCGFYSPKRKLLFSGDLFASFFYAASLPPAIFNSCPEQLPGSLEKALRLQAQWIIPNHYDIFHPGWHRRRLEKLCRRLLSKKPGFFQSSS